MFRARQDEVKVADAYAQAAVDAALEIERNTIIVQGANHDEGQYEEDADTLGMLEMLAKRHWHKDIRLGSLLVSYQRRGPGLTYWNTETVGEFWQSLTRAEAEALLGEGKEKKG